MPGPVIHQQNHQPSYPYRIAVIENNMQVMSGVSYIVNKKNEIYKTKGTNIV
jgi:hypothetical protein